MSAPTSLTVRVARRDLLVGLLRKYGEPISVNGIADQWPGIGMRWGVRLDIAIRDGLEAGLLEWADYGKLRAGVAYKAQQQIALDEERIR